MLLFENAEIVLVRSNAKACNIDALCVAALLEFSNRNGVVVGGGLLSARMSFTFVMKSLGSSLVNMLGSKLMI